MKKGFTLSEIMVAITVLGILCATVLPSVNRLRPNQNRAMVKKAYYNFETVVSELINNFDYYPASDGVCPENNDSGYVGFDCQTSDSRFPWLFAKTINMDSRMTLNQANFAANYVDSGLTNCIGAGSKCYKITSADGMIWTFSKSPTFVKGDSRSGITVGVDVNGDKGPNEYQTQIDESTRKDFDRFRMYLSADGKIEVGYDDEWAMEVIDTSTSLLEH